jgi:1,4-dihydroxy-2-naphthoyl-CoA hydrolase
VDGITKLNAHMLPFAALLGVRFTTAELDRIVAELLIRDELCTSLAVAHGGVIMAFADTLGAAGTILNLADGSHTTTIESKTNFSPRPPPAQK